MIEIKVQKRKLLASGTAVALTVPTEWLKENKLDVGQEVMMVMNGNLTFMPATKENLNKIRNQLHHATVGSPAISSEDSADTQG